MQDGIKRWLEYWAIIGGGPNDVIALPPCLNIGGGLRPPWFLRPCYERQLYQVSFLYFRLGLKLKKVILTFAVIDIYLKQEPKIFVWNLDSSRK